MNAAQSAISEIEPIAGALCVVGGTRVEGASPRMSTLAPPPRAARGREGERLFVLLDLTGPASPHLYRELHAVVAQAYWSTTGSITAGLRQAAAAANDHLFRSNLRSAPSDRCEGGLISAVLHDDDLFILQAGSGRACFAHGEHVGRFSRGEEPPPLGVGPLADVRLYHTFVAPGDMLLLASPALIRQVGDVGLARVLSRAGVKAVLDGLEQVGAGADFAALAKEHSACPSGKNGGELGFGQKSDPAKGRRGSWVPPFEKAAFDLPAGQISDVVETRFGYHIIKAIEHKEASTETFEQAKEKIMNQTSKL